MSKDPIKAHFEESLVRAATQASDETIKQASKELIKTINDEFEQTLSKTKNKVGEYININNAQEEE